MLGGNLDLEDYDGRRAMHLAAAEGHKHVLKFLLENRAYASPLDRYACFIEKIDLKGTEMKN